MADFLTAGIATAATIWGYMAMFKPITDSRHYVSQQLAQMQAHRYNKQFILIAAKNIDSNNNNNRHSLELLIKQIFDDYDKMIQAEKWCWIKKDNKIICVNKTINKDICKTQRHNGIFPPLAGLEKMLQPCTINIDSTNWKRKWETAAQAYAKITYMSSLEYYIYQLEALEQDMAIMKLKY